MDNFMKYNESEIKHFLSKIVFRVCGFSIVECIRLVQK
uniref:Abortive infection protein n=1 Tax=Heterorhabditis bacteriophora TaxID=37862 RepID=A0A1I7W807_HETBA